MWRLPSRSLTGFTRCRHESYNKQLPVRHQRPVPIHNESGRLFMNSDPGINNKQCIQHFCSLGYLVGLEIYAVLTSWKLYNFAQLILKLVLRINEHASHHKNACWL